MKLHYQAHTGPYYKIVSYFYRKLHLKNNINVKNNVCKPEN